MSNLEVGQGPSKRVKIFTVHGTFAHDTEWDNWDDADDKTKSPDDRSFINLLGQYLGENGIAFNEADHTQYNWSGGNSHDERRTAAIGLKKFIQHDLNHAAATHGKAYKDYYNGGVFVVGHSHGGTITRMAMNLWDKGDEYFDPTAKDGDALKHNDKCPICKQHRNGDVAPNTIARPDGVITFGSPFVHFKTRKMGLLSARLLAWAMIIPGFIAAIALAVFLFSSGGSLPKTTGVSFIDALLASPLLQSALAVLWPVALFWLFALYIPKRFVATTERIFGKKSSARFLATSISRIIGFAGIVALSAYFIAYVYPGSDSARGWFEGMASSGLVANFHLWFPLVIFWLLAISLPRRLLAWAKTEVAGLRDELPKKYDPDEDKDNPTPYLSYNTPGDEAGLGLNIFGFITWVVQTLWLAAAIVMAVGLASVLLIALAAGLSGKGLSGFPGFIPVMDALTFYPVLVWNWVFGWFTPTRMFNLGGLENSAEIAKGIPVAFSVVVGVMLFILMPLILVATGIANLVSAWLRSSGLAFGSERFTWTVANNISASRRPSTTNTKLKSVLISPEAWSKGEVAHCYYYQSDAVIRDVASNIAGWHNFIPDRSWQFGLMLKKALRWLVVLFLVQSLFMVSVQWSKDKVNAATTEQQGQPIAAPTPAASSPAPRPN